eukprot:9276654-Alexandrium_andersonii.AAC.1
MAGRGCRRGASRGGCPGAHRRSTTSSSGRPATWRTTPGTRACRSLTCGWPWAGAGCLARH